MKHFELPSTAHLTACLLPLALLFATPGCFGPKGQHMTAAEYEAHERSTLSDEVAAQAADGRATGGAREDLQREADELDSQLAEVRHDLDEMVFRRERIGLEQASDELRLSHASQAAQQGLVDAQTAKVRFVEVLRPLRIEEDALNLAGAADALLETREELAQLELMYSGAELGEGTAEIVIERTRRRLARSEARHAIAVRRSRELLEVDLPREQGQLELAVAAARVEATNAERAVTVGVLERQAALRELDHEEAQLKFRFDGMEKRRIAHESKLRDLERRTLAGFGELGA